MKKMTLLLAFLLGLACTDAQTNELPAFPVPIESMGRASFDLVLELEMGFPLDNFKSAIGHNVLAGKGIALFYRFRKMPVDVGFRMGNFSYDHIRREFDDYYVQKTKNKIGLGYGAVRIVPLKNHPDKLYFEGSYGWRRYHTKTFSKSSGITIGDDSDGRFDEKSLHSDVGAEWGLAMGTKFVFDKSYGSAIDVQVGYRRSNSGQFYISKGLANVAINPIDNLSLRRAALSMLSVKVGMSLLVRSY